MEKEQSQLEVPVGSSAITPESLMKYAIEKGAVDVVERLMKMRADVKAERAKEAYDEAMATFQAVCPVIRKEKEVKGKDRVTTRYKYAPLEHIIDTTRGLLQLHGFSYGFDTEVVDKQVKVWCIVRHKLGHSERSSFTAPIDPDAFMNAPQKSASAMTYAKRYAFINAFGITVGGEDTDTAEVNKPKDKASKEQHDEINTLAAEAGMTLAEVAKKCRDHYGVSIKDVSPVQADGIIGGLKTRITEKTKKV